MLSIVIPLHNEEQNVEPLYQEIVAAKQQLPEIQEVVFVDDASTDTTAEVLRRLQQSPDGPKLTCVSHSARCGQSMAMRTGVRHASGSIIATLDGDGQNDPANIIDLYRTLMKELGVTQQGLVIGRRAKRRDTFIRRLSSRVANGVRSRMLGDATPDTGCGLKMFYKSFYLQLPYFHHQHRFLPALTVREGCAVYSVAINHRPRERGVSKYGVWNRLWVGIVDLFGVYWLQKRYTAGVSVHDLRH